MCASKGHIEGYTGPFVLARPIKGDSIPSSGGTLKPCRNDTVHIEPPVGLAPISSENNPLGCPEPEPISPDHSTTFQVSGVSGFSLGSLSPTYH